MDFNTGAPTLGASSSVYSRKQASERSSLSARRRCFWLPLVRAAKSQAGVVTPLECAMGCTLPSLWQGISWAAFPPVLPLGSLTCETPSAAGGVL